MEEPAEFCLNNALARWRQELASGGLSPAELEELTAHIHDSVQALEAGGLTSQQAWAVALEGLGPPPVLSTEFAKIQPRRVWLDRAFWMAAGIVLMTAIGYISHWLYYPILSGVATFTKNFTAGSLVATLAGIAIKAGLLVSVWRLRPGLRQAAARLAERCLHRPLVPFVVTAILVASLLPLSQWILASWALKNFSPTQMTSSVWMHWIPFTVESICVVGLPFWIAVLRRQWQPEFVPGQEAESPGALQQRRWIGHCFWMASGVAGSLLVRPILMTCQQLAYMLSGLVIQDVAWRTAAYSLAEWVGGAAVLLILWRSMSRSKFLDASRLSWFDRHQILTFLGTIGIYAIGLGLYFTLLNWQVHTGHPRVTLSGAFAVTWMFRIAWMLMFIILFYWLGRQALLKDRVSTSLSQGSVTD